MKLFIGGGRSQRCRKTVWKAVKRAGLEPEEISEVFYGSDIGTDEGVYWYCRLNKVPQARFDETVYEFLTEEWLDYMRTVMYDCDAIIIIKKHEYDEKGEALEAMAIASGKPYSIFDADMLNPYAGKWWRPKEQRPE